MNNKIKMLKGELYNSSDPVLIKERAKAKELCQKYNTCDRESKETIIKDLFANSGENIIIEPNFFCDYGYNINVGNNFYMNYNGVILDVCEVTIGDNVLIGPNCGIYTAYHPLSLAERQSNLECGKKIKIGNDVWIGGNTVVLPGVTIGDNVVIGAGSVVTKNIPSNSLAFGNPCKVVRNI